MCYYQETMANIKSYLLKTNDGGFKKIAGTSAGFLYEKSDMLFNVTVYEDMKFVTLKAYKGLTLANKAFLPAVIKYCQEVKAIGSLQVDAQHSEVFYRIETPFLESAVSEEAFKECERQAIAVIENHFSTLDDLCHGKLIIEQHREKERENGLNCKDYMKSFIEIEDYFYNGNHNIVSKRFEGIEDTVFVCDIIDGSNRYTLKVIFSPSYITFKMYPGSKGIFVDKPYEYMAAVLCNEESYTRKVGYIGIDSDGRIYCKIEASMIDGNFGGTTIERIESLAMLILLDCSSKLELISHGVPPAEDNEIASSLTDLLSKIPKQDTLTFPFVNPSVMEEDDDDYDYYLYAEDNEEDADDQDSGMLRSDELADLLDAIKESPNNDEFVEDK